MNDNKANINYYPGHMAKTKRQIGEIIDLIDIVYEVLDARIPYSSKIKDIDELIKNKERILIMTKKDLCDMDNTNKWIKYYEKSGYKVLCLDLKDNKDYKKIFDLTKKCTVSIQEKRKEKGLKEKDIKALVIGIPNVGKSTLINQMVGRKVAVVENKPGVTKKLNFLSTNMGITLLDSPGILWPKFEDENIAYNIACVGSIKKEVLPLNDVALHLIDIYINNYLHVIKDFYKINDYKNNIDVLEKIAINNNFYYYDEIDYALASEKVYNDYVLGKVKNITLDICK